MESGSLPTGHCALCLHHAESLYGKECMATACLGLSVLKTGEGIVFPSHTMVGIFWIYLENLGEVLGTFLESFLISFFEIFWIFFWRNFLACLGLSVLKTGEGIVFPSHTMVGIFWICLKIMDIIFCVEFWELSYFTTELSHAENKIRRGIFGSFFFWLSFSCSQVVIKKSSTKTKSFCFQSSFWMKKGAIWWLFSNELREREPEKSWMNVQNHIYFTQNGQSCHFEWK